MSRQVSLPFWHRGELLESAAVNVIAVGHMAVTAQFSLSGANEGVPIHNRDILFPLVRRHPVTRLPGFVPERLIVERADPDVAEADRAVVVLQEDGAGGGLPLPRPDLL